MRQLFGRKFLRLGGAVAAGLGMIVALPGIAHGDPAPDTATPIQHLVVIFQENVSFDHYFGTYPKAANADGQTFTAKPGTPSVNGLSNSLLTANPNLANPMRLANTTAEPGLLTCDQDHNYTDEQKAFNNGAVNLFVQSVGTSSGTYPGSTTACNRNDVMDYYDGNTVTALWNYAQNYVMSDNSFGTTFGPSAPGAIKLVSGDTGDVDTTHEANSPSHGTANADLTPDGTTGGFSLTSDAQPYYDDCSTHDAAAMSGTNVGDLLNNVGLSWGWFQGGFRPTTTFSAAASATSHSGQSTATFTPDEFSGSFIGKNVPPHASNQALCDSVHPVGVAIGGTGQYGFKDDYIAHHEPFQYYASTANPHHLTIPINGSGTDTLAGLREIGNDTQHYVSGTPQFDTPNHQYDTSDFDQLVASISKGDTPPSALPAVSFLKAPGYEDGHAAYSDPTDEQLFITNEINALMATPDWRSTAVIVSYDDSDGWYDHVYSGVTNPSQGVADALTSATQCGTSTSYLGGEQGRCGYGPRLPLLVISPWAKANYVDHTLTDQSSILAFIEDNWLQSARIPGSFDAKAGSLTNLFNFTKPHGEPPIPKAFLLNPTTGQPLGKSD